MRLALVAAVMLLTGCAHTAHHAPPPRSAISRIQTGGSPCGVAEAAGAAWVSDAADGRLLRIDPTTHSVRTTATLDPTPCEMTVAFGSLWVTTQSGFLDRVDPASGRLTGHAPVGMKSYEAKQAAGAMWVSDRDSAQLTRVDPVSLKTSVLPLPGTDPGGLVLAFGALWVGDDTSDATALTRVDPLTRKVTRVPAGLRPAYVTATATDVWVSNSGDGTVSRIDPTTLAATTVRTGGSPVNLDVVAGDVWVPDDTGGTVTRLDGRTGRVTQTVRATDLGPAVVAPVDGQAWVTMFSGGQVWAITPSGAS